MLQNYKQSGNYDEMLDETGATRPHYQKFRTLLDEIPAEEFGHRRQSVDLAFLRQGITFNVYGDEQGVEKIFPFDLIPRIIPAHEWEFLERGLAQRITALNLFLHDVYHDQKILKDGVIPPYYVLSGKHFRREFVNFKVPRDIYIHVCGTDLIRGAKGEWMVLEDNARCPSGVSYLLENRRAMKRSFSGMFESIGVRPVEHYPEELLKMLQYIAPTGVADPTIALLTPGACNSAYFEHTYLARQMGIEIVEGRDLMVRDESVFMRTTKGLQQVHVIYRRKNPAVLALVSHLVERMHEVDPFDRGFADRDREVGLDGDVGRFVGPLLRRGARGRQVDGKVHGRKRRRDHEDDQEDEHDVDERRDVDVVHFAEFVVIVQVAER